MTNLAHAIERSTAALLPGPRVIRSPVVAAPPAARSLFRERAVEAVLFDLDHTLVRFDASRLPALIVDCLRPVHQRLQSLGYQPPSFPRYAGWISVHIARAVIRSKITRREIAVVETVRRAHAKMGVSMSAAEVLAIGRACGDVLLSRVTRDGHAWRTLAVLRAAGLKLGLVSNTLLPGSAVDEYLSAARLIEFLPVRVYSSEVRWMKPHPEIFRCALRALDAPPEKAVFVGDCLRRDVRGAARLGMETVLLSPGARSCRPFTPGCVIHSLSQLPGLFVRADRV